MPLTESVPAPVEGVSVQVTAVLLEPFTVAVKACVCEAVTLALTVYNRLNITMFVFAGRTGAAKEEV